MDIIGHTTILASLKKDNEKQTLSHAYLFHGPDKVGKMKVAQWFAQLLLCKEEENKDFPCGTCLSCKKFLSQSHPDIIIIKPEEGKKNISVETIRSITRECSLYPYSSNYKIILVDQAEKLGRESANAFLKLLEEPPSYVIFVLISSKPAEIISTIHSRVRKIRFLPLSEEDILEYLRSYTREELSQEEKDFLLRESHGKIGWILENLSEKDKIKNIVAKRQEVIALIEKTMHERLLQLETWDDSIEALTQRVETLTYCWQGILHDKIINNKTPRQCSTKIHELIPLNEIRHYLDHLLDITHDLRYNINKRILLESLVINMPTITNK